MPTTETREAGQELTPFDRGQIYGEMLHGASEQQVARLVGFSRGAVQHTMKMLADRINGQSMLRNGRVQKTTSTQDKALCDRLQEAPTIFLHVFH